MNEDQLTLSLVKDKIRQCENKYMITCTGFLDMRQQTICSRIIKENPFARGFYYGGREDSERRCAVFFPEYVELEEGAPYSYFCREEEDNPLCIARASFKGKALSHRDFLGSLLGLGLKREKIGDIYVHRDFADTVIMKDIGEFILSSYSAAGRTPLSVSILPVSDVKEPEYTLGEKSCTVASLRVDNVLSGAFGLSRGKVAEAIKAGLVFQNNMEVTKAEKQVAEGDKLNLRGKGKVVLEEIGGNTRKDRIFIRLKTYL